MANWLTCLPQLIAGWPARGSFSTTDGLGLIDERTTFGDIEFAIDPRVDRR